MLTGSVWEGIIDKLKASDIDQIIGYLLMNEKAIAKCSYNITEKQLFDKLQQITGLPKNRLIIDLLLDAKLAPKEYTSELQKLNQQTANLSEQVKRIGVNINQLARVANSTKLLNKSSFFPI